jgi:hypothetical protein
MEKDLRDLGDLDWLNHGGWKAIAAWPCGRCGGRRQEKQSVWERVKYGNSISGSGAVFFFTGTPLQLFQVCFCMYGVVFPCQGLSVMASQIQYHVAKSSLLQRCCTSYPVCLFLTSFHSVSYSIRDVENTPCDLWRFTKSSTH